MKITPKIRVSSRISDDESTESFDFTAEAVISGTQDNYTIEYTENLIPEAVTSTVIRVLNGNTVTVVRSGDISHEITAEPGKKHPCRYMTPYGELSFDICGRRVSSTVCDTGGALEIEYEICYPNGASTAHRMTIDII